MSENIYKGRGNASMHADFVDFINYVFGFNGNDQDFIKLLPKLYKPEYHPCENNYVVTEDGKLKAAIGVFPRELDVMGETLRVTGVGNVAVHPYSRSKGYMRELLGSAVRDMIADGVDMSDLGGLRQRYGYFSYEVASPVCVFELNHTCLRHSFAGVPLEPLGFVEITDPADQLLDRIFALHSKKPLHMLREREAFLDVAHSWSKKLFAIVDGERFVGYFIDRLDELTLADIKDFDRVVRCYVDKRGSVSLKLPLGESELISAAERICDDVRMVNDQNYTVFHWKKVVGAFLRLKAASAGLADGELSFLVHGVAGDEAFGITVRDGKAAVTDSRRGEITLDHREAVAYFFGLVSPKRMRSGIASSWFPLPLFIDSADHG